MHTHPFVVPLAQLVAISGILLVLGAWLRSAVSKDKPLAFHVLALWGLTVLLANMANSAGFSAPVILASVAVGLVAAGLGVGAPKAWQGLWSGIAAQKRDIWFLLVVLCGQIGVYLVPLLTVFPARTLITGNFVCNDSVAHAVMMRGSDVVRGQFGAWQHLDFYPDGINALAFALTSLFPVQDAPYFLLPVTMWSTSFFGLAIVLLLDREGEFRSFQSALVAIAPAAAFLLGTSVYLFFVGHMGALPFVVGSVVLVASWSPDDFKDHSLFLFLLPMAASIAVYGLLSASLIGFALVLRLASQAMVGTSFKADSWRLLKAVTSPAAIGDLVVVGALTAPVIVDLCTGYAFFAGMTTSVGNLPGGFLSPFHVTGFWKDGAEYRNQLGGPDSYAATVLAGIFVGQVWCMAHGRLGSAARITLAVFGVPVVASAVLPGNPYINFKYLCFLTAVWVPLSTLALGRILRSGRLWQAWAPDGLVAATLVLMVVAPVRSYTELTPLLESQFRTLDAIRDMHLSRGPVLILSAEDWFHYYRDADEIAPLTMYFRQRYERQPVREVLVDGVFEWQAKQFLASHFDRAVARLDESCHSQTVRGRFRFYDFACLTSSQP